MKNLYIPFIALVSPILAFTSMGVDNPQKNQSSAEIKSIETICEQDKKYLGWPTVCALKSGEIMVAFSGDREGHICPYGKVQIIKSFDNGKTWTSPENVVNTVFDDRDAGLIELGNGNLLLAMFNSLYYKRVLDVAPHKVKNPEEWKKNISLITEKDIAQNLGSWVYISADKGKKWSSPIKLKGSAPHGPIELSSGKILYVGKVENRLSDGQGGDIIVEESADGGRTWTQISTIKIPSNIKKNHCFEPHAVEASNGKIIAHIRCHKNGFLLQCESSDGGKTWSTPTETQLFGYPSHLARLDDGTLLATYGRRGYGFKNLEKRDGKLILPDGRQIGISGIFACLSYDNGKTWDVKNEICLSLCDTDDLGYPSTVALKDKSLLTVFYQRNSNQEQTVLKATHWRIKK